MEALTRHELRLLPRLDLSGLPVGGRGHGGRIEVIVRGHLLTCGSGEGSSHGREGLVRSEGVFEVLGQGVEIVEAHRWLKLVQFWLLAGPIQ